jgi:hypothetical protein
LFVVSVASAVPNTGHPALVALLFPPSSQYAFAQKRRKKRCHQRLSNEEEEEEGGGLLIVVVSFFYLLDPSLLEKWAKRGEDHKGHFERALPMHRSAEDHQGLCSFLS